MPTTTSLLSGVTINEIHASPDGVAQDVNSDGVGNGNDEFIEIFNTSGSAVNLNGWEIWESGFLRHTFGAGDNIAAGGYFTIVDSAVGGTIINVTPPAAFNNGGASLTFNNGDNYALYSPATNQYILVNGPTPSANEAANVSAITGAHAGAGQVGVTETMNTALTGQSYFRVSDGDITWGADSTPTPGDANCFAAGTLIATPDGEVAVETLQPGDMVTTGDGGAVPVKWVGRQSIRKFAWGEKAQPVRIVAGALGDGLPHSDLTVTADHGMIIDGLLINAAALINGSSIDWAPLSDLDNRFTVYHVETPDHDVILANGAPAETFMDAAGRASFDNLDEYLDLYGAERIIPEMRRVRIGSSRLLPDAIKAHLGIGRDGGNPDWFETQSLVG